ncbi:hypothetical protein BDZ89DRAFT_1142002 [Hymenopellis radicata]|nr:hypothetical protein BDZ89DRAFT_1142002 [Hymenopellis radicata]
MELPTELVHLIVAYCWRSNSSNADPSDLLCLMTALPLINHQWKAVYAYFSGRNLWIPSVSYLFYIGTILRTNHSVIYHRPSELSQSVLTINCAIHILNEHYIDTEKRHVSKREHTQRLEAYSVLASLPSYKALAYCFPHAVLVLSATISIPDKTTSTPSQRRRARVKAAQTRIIFPLNGTHSEWTVKLQDTKLMKQETAKRTGAVVVSAEDYVPLDKLTLTVMFAALAPGPVIVSPKRGKITRGKWRPAHRARNVYHYQALNVKCGSLAHSNQTGDSQGVNPHFWRVASARMPRLSRSWWRIWKKWLAESVRDEGAFDVVSQLEGRKYDRQERWFALIRLAMVGIPVRDD